MNWTDLQAATSRPSYTTRSLVTRVSVTTWLAAAKLGRLVFSQFVRCEHSRWKACGEVQFSSIQFMCYEQAFTCQQAQRRAVTSVTHPCLFADIQLVSEHGQRHLRSSSYRTLAVPRTRTTLGHRNLTVAGPRVWNSLPATIGQITSYRQFRQHLKTHLFRA